MSEPFLQFEQTHRFLSIEQLCGDRGTCSVTCNSTSNIALRHTCFSAQLRDQIMIEARLSDRPHTVEKQEVHDFAGFWFAELGLRWTNFLLGVDGLSHDPVHGLCKGCSSCSLGHPESRPAIQRLGASARTPMLPRGHQGPLKKEDDKR